MGGKVNRIDFMSAQVRPCTSAASLTRRTHILISAKHHTERFGENDPWVIFNKIYEFQYDFVRRKSPQLSYMFG